MLCGVRKRRRKSPTNSAADTGASAGVGADGTGNSGTGGSASSDAIAQFTSKFVGAVDAVASRTTGPLLVAVRAVVYALVIALAAIAVITLVVIAAVRGIDTAVEVLFSGEVWLTYFICAFVFLVIGWVFWAKRRRSPQT